MAMTDARFPERWLLDRRIDGLDDRDFRSFVSALVWSVSNRTDGVITEPDLDRIPHFDRRSVFMLVARALWDATDTGWQITEFEDTQTSRDDLAVLTNARRAKRDAQRRRRARRSEEESHGQGAVADYVGDYSVPVTAQARTGQARTGQEGKPGTALSEPEKHNSHAVDEDYQADLADWYDEDES
jgi:hypothetical protein